MLSDEEVIENIVMGKSYRDESVPQVIMKMQSVSYYFVRGGNEGNIKKKTTAWEKNGVLLGG